MATIEVELTELKQRVEQLESTVRQLTEEKLLTKPSVAQPLDEATLVAILKAEGILVEPPAAALAHAQRWQARPESEKQAIRHELNNLPPGPMASDIIIENRR